jgi:hypothetical protein
MASFVVRQECGNNIAALREQPGEVDFAVAWAEGETMTLDEAVAYALGTDESS